MTENTPVMEQAKATGTWSITAPGNHFSAALYHNQGKTFVLPVEVSGEKITFGAAFLLGCDL